MLDITTALPMRVITSEPALVPLVTIPTLPQAINAAHEAATVAGKTALLKAKEAGDLLLQAKEECAHGTFQAWIEENCAFSYRTAAAYMKVAKNAVDCTFDNATTLADFLEAHATPRAQASAPTATGCGGDSPATATTPKPANPRVSELKAEIDRLAGELQAARDALATAEAHIGAMKAGTTSDTIPADEVAALRQENAELHEMFDEADAERKSLRKEVETLKRQVRKLTPMPEAPPKYNPAADF